MHARCLFRIVTLSLAFGLTGCGSGGETSGSSGGAGAAGGAVGGSGGAGAGGSSSSAANGPNGIFEVHFISNDTTSIADIGGQMLDGPSADAVTWEITKTEGECSLYKPNTPFCESCASGQVCVGTNVCRAQPGKQSVGTVTLTGLNSTTKPLPLTLVAGTYSSAETVALPACTAGGTVRLDASGDGAYSAFNVQTKCIAPLAVASSTATIESGKAFTMTWTAGSVADARIVLEFDLSHHGGSKGQIRCETSDSGTLQVSAALVKSLMDLGVTGFPWLTVTRIAKGTAAVGSGQALLKVYSDQKITLEVPGLKSCSSDSECSTGQTCLIPSYMCGVACTTVADCASGQTCQNKICK
jgi:hypothetical protein